MPSDNLKKNNFSKIAENIYNKHEQYDKLMKKTLITKKVMSLTEFYEIYQQKAQEKCLELTPSREQPSISEFEENFRALEEYPMNMQQKHKKHSPKKLTRFNSTLRGSSTSLAATSTTAVDTIPSTALVVGKCEQPIIPDVRKVFTDFKRLQQKLLQIMELNQSCDSIGEQLQEVQFHQLQLFSRNLDKLLPSDRNIRTAFDADEVSALELLMQQVEQLNFIKEHQNIFDAAETTQNNDKSCRIDERTRQIIEILNNCLTALAES